MIPRNGRFVSILATDVRLVGRGSAEQRTASRWSEIELFFNGDVATIHRLVRSRDERERSIESFERYESGQDLIRANESKGSAFWQALDEAAADRAFAAWLGDDAIFENVGLATSHRPLIVLPVLRDGSPIYRRSTFRGARVSLRSLRFPGFPIGRASSRDGDHDRVWLEVTIYAVDDGDRAANRRWVVHRAGQTDRGLSHSSFAIVAGGAEALRFLADDQTGWVAASALDALDDAVRNDEGFANSMGDLLENTNFREITGRDRVTDTHDRRILEALGNGAILIALGDGPRKIVWKARASNIDRPTPAAFLQLSRRGFIRKLTAGDGFSEWTVSDRGRAALTSTRNDG